MGMDLLEISLSAEEAFAIKIDASDFERLARDRDIVVGDLYVLILHKIHYRETVRTSVSLNFAVWEELQKLESRLIADLGAS
jgi:hypothetical protein